MEDFSDRHHVEQIRQALWRGGPFGKAAIMVGAGFSRNADSSNGIAREFPLWPDLVKHLYDAIHPRKASESDESRKRQYERHYATSAALRLAEEYAVGFGRTRLDELLSKAIPDLDYSPGKLHHLLLRLPWSDIFTTNYDTLLERARDFVSERAYEVVQTKEDIPVATRPRIIKLHGSFPSHRPFIFTEEDYRTYPREFPAFVNMVQQSIMENILCLVGFSGDDPNFLNWAGWVRDILGRSTLKVYLCGLLNLTDSTRQMFHSRHVIPIDLSAVVPTSVFPDSGRRHRIAMEWFLLSLENGRPPDRSLWPMNRNIAFTSPSPGVPPPLGSSHRMMQPERTL